MPRNTAEIGVSGGSGRIMLVKTGVSCGNWGVVGGVTREGAVLAGMCHGRGNS